VDAEGPLRSRHSTYDPQHRPRLGVLGSKRRSAQRTAVQLRPHQKPERSSAEDDPVERFHGQGGSAGKDEARPSAATACWAAEAESGSPRGGTSEGSRSGERPFCGNGCDEGSGRIEVTAVDQTEPVVSTTGERESLTERDGIRLDEVNQSSDIQRETVDSLAVGRLRHVVTT
jgi:hypothetical protein